MSRAPAGPIKLTYEDYVDLPDDGRRYEILDGALEVSPAPSLRHQGVSRNLLVVLHTYLQERHLGTVYSAPIDVLLASTTIVQPDLVFVAAGHEAIMTARAIEGPPDLVVEILSSWSTGRDRVTKAALYARYGIPHYWLLDPEERLFEVYEAEGAEYRLLGAHQDAARVTAAPFPDLELDLGRIWA